MPDANYQVADVLMLVGNVAPVALYFLVLGLVNSHARPCLVTSRSDFVALTSVLVPFLLWPVPVMARSGMWWPLFVGAALAAVVFVWLLRTTGDGFVIYNISEARCTKLIEQAFRHLGWQGRWEGSLWRSDAQDISIHVRKFPLLRNVSLSLELPPQRREELLQTFGRELHNRLADLAQLPSTMGAALVFLGVALMVLPMWMVGRHIHDLVDAMSHLFG